MKKLTLIILLFYVVSILNAVEKSEISVFYKEMKPSQQVLARVDSLLNNFLDLYNVQYYNIGDEENSPLIKELGLPGTHFPFAIVIGGKFTANIEGKTISFVHFPLFMKGIGRHEGNWSLEALQQVLESNNLLSDKNILPILEEEDDNRECED